MPSCISVLFPPAALLVGAVTCADTPPSCFADLHLDHIVDAVTAGHTNDHLTNFFYTPLHDVATVQYRHEVFRDLDNDEICQAIKDFVIGLATMRRRLQQAQQLWHPLQRQSWFVDAIETYCDTVILLHKALNLVEPVGRGLRDFACYIGIYVDSESFQTLVADTKAVQNQLHRVRYTVHIDGLRVHVDKFVDQSDYSAEITATFERFATEVSTDYHVPLKSFPDMNHVEEQILDCVAKLYPEAFAPLDSYCQLNKHFVEPTIARFEDEIQFYLSYRTFIRRLATTGLTFSYPEITTAPGALYAQNAFDLAVALNSIDDDKCVAANSFQLSGTERILVVTGPNQGGKTTFGRTIGQCIYLSSLGCPVPASQATFTLPDQVYTHFERQESLSRLQGKLDDELVRIHAILSHATAASIVIMNESFSSTTVEDALFISTAVLDRIVALRCVAVYVTFLDELASLDPTCVSMVGEVAQHDRTQRTFTFSRRPADGLAYAAALADKYRLNYDTLVQRICQ